MVLEIHTQVGSTVPLYRQIVDQVRLAVSTGNLAPGDQLPSVRALAEQLVINPNTVAKAYATLTQEGVVEAYPGKGLFVAQRRQTLSNEERGRRLESALHTFLSEILFLDFTKAEILDLLEQRLDAVDAPAAAQDVK
ncbi:GntR family transcriptional regulator [bacterium]|nr:MAG: GntR family transcriptional regulator [bacterium]